jgi:DNA polymerase-3 subunit gamma/tau
LGITFKQLRQDEQQVQQQAEPEITNKEENNAFTEENLLEAWIGMCNRMPTKMKAMAQRMKNMQPHIIAENQIELVVDNEILLGQISEIKGRIRATLAKDLHNGQIQLAIRQAAVEEIKPILSKREVFDTIRRDNPALEKLRQLLDLQLA